MQIMTWLGLNLNPNKLVFIDGRVKRRWSSDYFYELLAYAHDGRIYSKINYPKRGSYSKVPTILRKLRIKPNQGYLLPQLLKDDEFAKWAKKNANFDRGYYGIQFYVSDYGQSYELKDKFASTVARELKANGIDATHVSTLD